MTKVITSNDKVLVTGNKAYIYPEGGGTPEYIKRSVSDGKLMRTSSTTISMPSNITSIDSFALYYAYYESEIVTVDFSNIETVYGGSAMDYCFYDNTHLTSVDLSGLTTVNPGNQMYGMQGTFKGCTALTTVDLSSLSSVGTGGFASLFFGCSALTSISLPSLQTLHGGSSMLSCFKSSGLTSITFPVLSNIAGNFLIQGAFEDCASLTSVSFPALTKNSFGNYTNQFYHMLTDVTGCTVHFPASIRTTIQNWNDVLAGFNGTNTTILYDLHAATITFNVTPTSTIYVEDRTVTDSVVIGTAEDMPYTIYNAGLNLVYANVLTNLVDDETRTITLDLSQETTHKISFATGVTGLTGYVVVNDKQIPLLEETSGTYTINYSIPNGTSISYLIYGGEEYANATGTITVQGADITETITLQPSVWVAYTRPNLTENGTIGGNTFAVSADAYSTNYPAWKAVDSNTSSYWRSLTGTAGSSLFEFLIYSPQSLKLSGVELKYYSTTGYQAKTVKLEGSKDNSTWTTLYQSSGTESSSTTKTITGLSTAVTYKYFKLTLCPNKTSVYLMNIGMTATVKQV